MVILSMWICHNKRLGAIMANRLDIDWDKRLGGKKGRWRHIRWRHIRGFGPGKSLTEGFWWLEDVSTYQLLVGNHRAFCITSSFKQRHPNDTVTHVAAASFAQDGLCRSRVRRPCRICRPHPCETLHGRTVMFGPWLDCPKAKHGRVLFIT